MTTERWSKSFAFCQLMAFIETGDVAAGRGKTIKVVFHLPQSGRGFGRGGQYRSLSEAKAG